ncbi:hypothetical protein ABT104_06205 [Streptomyces mobaraensis]|uniref:hypothetical protein n=1 Tax=Streptomyces mobaraensis TaxID=35621 RepID=UPI003325B0DB
MSEDELKRRLEALEKQTARIGELEAEVARLREDAASARALASMADRDVAEMRTTMRGHTQVLNAIRESQVEQGQVLDAHTTALEAQSRTLQNVAELVGQLMVGQMSMAEQLTRIEDRLGGDDAQEK